MNLESVVITGSWNLPLFSPAFVNDLLESPRENIDIGYQVENDSNIIKSFILEKFDMIIANNRFILKIKDSFNPDDNYEIYELIMKMLNKLQYNPIHGFGVNFKTNLPNNVYDISGFIPKYLIQKTIQSNFEIQYNLKENLINNLKIKKSQDNTEIYCNYHFTINSVSSLKEIFSVDLINELYQESNKIIESIQNEE